MTIHDEPMGQIGYDLLSHAEEAGETIRLPLITQLYPFLLLASRRMTTREMSDWLAKTKGVKISAPMITKGLKRPDLHLRRLAEYVQPLAAFVAAVHRLNTEGLLYGEDPKTGKSGLSSTADEVFSLPDEHSSESALNALNLLTELWEPIPHEVKFMCRPYFDFTQEPEMKNPNDDES